MTTRVALISCVKRKRTIASAAEELYVSDLFRSMRRYAQKNARDWYILSAKHGLLRREQIIEPYEQTLKTMAKSDRLAWAAKVQRQLLKELPPGAAVVMLAGERYRENIVPFLEKQGFSVEIPMAGKKLGLQLRWLKEQTR